jgi:hypothetical protein
MISSGMPRRGRSLRSVAVSRKLIPHIAAGRHRLYRGVLDAVVLLVAAVVGTAVVWGGASMSPTPLRLGPGAVASHPVSAGLLHPHVGQSGQSRWGRVAFASSNTSMAAGTATAINLYQGVSITPASGWTASQGQQGSGYVNLQNSDQTAAFYAQAGAADAPDINQQAAELINAVIKANGLTDVQRDPVGQVQTVQSGSNYQQLLEFGYTCDLQTDQGTEQLFGFWVALFNSSTRTMGFVDFNSPSPDALNIAMDDFKSMVSSML